MRKNHHKVAETALLADVKEWINDRYHELWAALCGADPTFGRAQSVLTTNDYYHTGTVTVNGTTTVIGSGTTFTSGMVGWKFKSDSYSEVYKIAAFVSATEITLDSVVNADADSGLSYVIYDDELSLPSDCNAVSCLSMVVGSRNLKKIGLREMRSKQVESPFTSSKIQYNDPSYWTYLSDSTIMLYPAPTRAVRIDLDYTKEFTELSDDEDEPILPIDYHRVLVVGAIADLLDWQDNPKSEKYEAKFQAEIELLKAKNAGNTDMPQVKLNVRRT